MAAVSSQRDLLSTAITFAGGLAFGLGGAYAISRGSFKPATAPTKSTKSKAEKAFGTPPSPKLAAVQDGPAKAAPAEPTRTPATTSTTTTQAEQPPASEQLDEVDAKGLGPVAPQVAKGSGAALHQRQQPSPHNARAVTGGDYPEPAPQNRARVLDLKADLTAPAPAHGDELLNAETAPAPVWLTGLTASAATRDTTAAGAIEGLAYSGSQALFVYESQSNGSFGAWSEKEAKEATAKGWIAGRPKVTSMQTRAGAGTAIAGYLSSRGTGSATAGSVTDKKTVTALINAPGLLAMAPAIATLPAAAQGRLVVQVSSASQDIEAGSLAVNNDYASVLSAASTLSVNEDFSVILSGSRQEAVDVAAATYAATEGHVVHVFDGAFAAREVAHLNVPAKADAAAASTDIISALKAKKLGHFSYYGPRAPSTVVVMPNGSHATNARTMLAVLPEEVRSHVGIVAARIVRPWSDEELVKALPSTVESIFVLEETRVAGITGPLFEDVHSAVFTGMIGRGASLPNVLPVGLPKGSTLQPGQWAALLQTLLHSRSAVNAAEVIANAASSVQNNIATLGGAGSRIVTFYDSDSSSTAHLASFLARTVREHPELTESASLLTRYDNFEAGGLARSDLLIGAHPAAQIPVQLAAQQGGTSTLVISDPATVLKSYKVFETLQVGGTILFNTPGWDTAELSAKLRAEDKKILAAKKARIYIINASQVVENILEETAMRKGGKSKVSDSTVPKEVATAVLAAALYRIQFGFSGASLISVLKRYLGVAPVGIDGVPGLVAAAEKALTLSAFSHDDFAAAEPLEAELKGTPRPEVFRYNGFGPSSDAATVGQEAVPIRNTWALSAWQMMFSEAYKLDDKSLRPDLPEKNYVVTVTENRRLTPIDYDRNVFHMELSTAGTGLKYEVGEALGVHGWNDEDEVKEFVNWSGYDPDELIAVPSLEDPSRYETRTVFQILQQRLDIFGKPGKSFYESLSKLALDKEEARWLRFISSAEGNSTFKKLSEVETVTYAEVLQMFPSARLPLDILLREVEMIKPRHYSISSAQAAVGDSVHLLVVTVDWQTPSGSPRYGQCTRYLANLRPGNKVTVSLKPSIMKLPPYTSQPIIMAGLGTGMAPFRAYVQAREVQKRNGEDVGPLLLYFGSRTQTAEWLYGEEFEAWHKDGLVERLGLAFSRDQKQKIYIQHKIKEDAKLVADYLAPDLEALRAAGGEVEILDKLDPNETDPKKKGMFCVCGPTWPIPDITEAIISSFKGRGLSQKEAENVIEALKEQERFVLEVY
ncbi:hypothetical protein BCV69DRAFT_282111 [Microstroma glucosiphilum]|uniref:assimilatory sulfite reductase (NADPH) n=1 Tax=Pseudomicrostroma glucosiphilum TaxID=1684307 RepID=A0A316UA81_9BASI|nr:hypothetical protein BCV69DRAFT_282111 [Pseudomicrostroma glucosiphilum]PWN21381.1 hypothetical protein BCV69DRAFT_282111 [Pseudomicrostroma glucosiphilum]